jgi:hypothetical protein
VGKFLKRRNKLGTIRQRIIVTIVIRGPAPRKRQAEQAGRARRIPWVLAAFTSDNRPSAARSSRANTLVIHKEVRIPLIRRMVCPPGGR